MADRGFVVVRDPAVAGPSGPGFRAAVARNFKSNALQKVEEEVSSSISSAVLAEGQAALIGNALESERFRHNPSVERLALRSLLCAPLVTSDDAFALIYLENRDIANWFIERHRRLLDEICRLAAPRRAPRWLSNTPGNTPASWNRRWAARCQEPNSFSSGALLFWLLDFTIRSA